MCIIKLYQPLNSSYIQPKKAFSRSIKAENRYFLFYRYTSSLPFLMLFSPLLNVFLFSLSFLISSLHSITSSSIFFLNRPLTSLLFPFSWYFYSTNHVFILANCLYITYHSSLSLAPVVLYIPTKQLGDLSFLH